MNADKRGLKDKRLIGVQSVSGNSVARCISSIPDKKRASR
jgi:hypothetical protein